MEAKNYKDTLLMPQTEFPMRGNLGQKEPSIQAQWEEQDLYHLLMKKNENNPFYVLHDGPPYANGSIHAGTAMNKCLKDFVLRYKNMSGFKAPYIPGWDTHGLPIENALSKDRKVNRKTMSTADFRELCKAYALEQVSIQRAQFKRLGVLGEWEKPYLTLEPSFEAAQIRLFGQMVEKGLIYKGLKPVYWSPSSESALAEAEIEYEDIDSPSIYVAMPVVDGKGLLPNDTSFVIWTTTPWTIPANLAIAAGDDVDYDLINVDHVHYIVAHALLEKLSVLLNWTDVSTLNSFKGRNLEGMTYRHPLYERVSPVVLSDHVTTEDGTGLVHIAPGHGEEDFLVGLKYQLDIYCPVDAHGIMMKEAGERFEGLFVDYCNLEVIKALTEENALLKTMTIKHSYPHDWRTKKPVIFRATPQWFASIELLKDDILSAIKTVTWYPTWGDLRLSNMIKDRGSWCISRQRTWGVPIPAFYTEKGTTILSKEVIDHVAELFAQYGSNVWFQRTANELLPEGFTHPDSPNGLFTKETDIMDVWFDSGSTHHGAMMERGLPYPADLYLEGSDQYRGWFNSSLITGIATMKQSPYKTLVSHGFITDGDGRKMSKSLGNVVDPNKIANTLGADIFRLWVASVDYQSDVRLSDNLINQVSETYRKLRNTFKFLLGNLFDFDVHVNSVDVTKMSDIDRYMIKKLNHLIEDTLAAYDTFQFDEVYRKCANFVTFASAFYLDFTKDILYIESADSLARRSIQTVMYAMLDALLRLLTPLIPHTTSEAYSYLPHKDELDVYLLSMPKPIDDNWNQEALYDSLMEVREDVLKALEEARNAKVIGKSLNAHVTLYPVDSVKTLLNQLSVNLAQIFIVSKLEIKEQGQGQFQGRHLSIDVVACEGETCERCWQVVDHLHDGLCDRCHTIVNP